MYSYTNRSRKVVSTITLIALIASQLSFLTLSDASSLTFSDYSATLITPNQ